MFSKNDFVEYFEQVKQIEHQMIHSFDRLAKSVSDPYLIKTFRALYQDEINHSNYVNNIIKMIQKVEE